MMTFDETTVGIWFVALNGESDYLACLSRIDGGHRLQYRFRYYNSPDPWDQKDEKSWYDMSSPAPLGVLIKNLREALKELPGEKWELIRGEETHEQFFERFLALPFVHTKDLDKVG